jgi:hypothetical protein
MNADTLYRTLLAAYPPGFRREYGDAMLEAFRDLHQARSHGRVRFWRFVLVDTLRSAIHAWTVACQERCATRQLRWIAACAVGTAACGGLGSAATWAFGYFYHPYLEGTAFVPWLYGAMLGAGLAVVQAITLGRGLRLGRLWIVTTASCAALGVEVAIAVAGVAGPAGYAVSFGSIVAAGQWIVLRGRLPRAVWWVLPSAAGLSAVALSTSASLTSALAGMEALRRDPFADVQAAAGLHLLLRGLYAPTSWTELAMGSALMAATGLLVGAITAKPVASAR